MMRYLLLSVLLIFSGFSRTFVKEAVLYYMKGKKLSVAKGKVDYEVGFYKVDLSGGGQVKYSKNQLIGISTRKPKLLKNLEKSSSDMIFAQMPSLLLDEKVFAFGWTYYSQFVYAISLINKKQYDKALNYVENIDKTSLKRSPGNAMLDFNLLSSVKLHVSVAKNDLEGVEKELNDMLNKKKIDDALFNYLTYIKARLLDKQAKINLAIIHYLKVVFLEKDATIYKINALERVIDIYKGNSDSRYKKFEEVLKKVLKG